LEKLFAALAFKWANSKSETPGVTNAGIQLASFTEKATNGEKSTASQSTIESPTGTSTEPGSGVRT
jgi:hypothetical protein